MNLTKMFRLKNIPNFLTILRILLIPSIILCIEINTEKYLWIALILYITACFSDFLMDILQGNLILNQTLVSS